jgi:TPR repeat protein
MKKIKCSYKSDKSNEYYASTAERNEPRSLSNFALLCERGEEIGKNIQKAANLYEPVADLGQAQEIFNVAFRY